MRQQLTKEEQAGQKSWRQHQRRSKIYMYFSSFYSTILLFKNTSLFAQQELTKNSELLPLFLLLLILHLWTVFIWVFSPFFQERKEDSHEQQQQQEQSLDLHHLQTFVIFFPPEESSILTTFLFCCCNWKTKDFPLDLSSYSLSFSLHHHEKDHYSRHRLRRFCCCWH